MSKKITETDFINGLSALKEYYEKFGTLGNIKPKDTYTYKGNLINIGIFVKRLRIRYRKGSLDKKIEDSLTSMGLELGYYNKLAPLIAYYNEFGTIANIKNKDIYKYKGKDVNMGILIANLRRPERKAKLTQEELDLLNNMGMEWRAVNDRIAPLREYYNEFGTIANIKQRTIYKYQGKDIRIGNLINHLRTEYKKGKLTQEEINELEFMGIAWRGKFNYRFQSLRAYYKEFGTISNIMISDVYNYQGKDVKIGGLINHLRTEYKKGKLTQKGIDELESMGMVWSYDKIAPLKAYYNEFGTIANIKQKDTYKYQDKNVRIGVLISILRRDYKNNQLTQEEIELLNSMGMIWCAKSRGVDANVKKI